MNQNPLTHNAPDARIAWAQLRNARAAAAAGPQSAPTRPILLVEDTLDTHSPGSPVAAPAPVSVSARVPAPVTAPLRADAWLEHRTESTPRPGVSKVEVVLAGISVLCATIVIVALFLTR